MSVEFKDWLQFVGSVAGGLLAFPVAWLTYQLQFRHERGKTERKQQQIQESLREELGTTSRAVYDMALLLQSFIRRADHPANDFIESIYPGQLTFFEAVANNGSFEFPAGSFLRLYRFNGELRDINRLCTRALAKSEPNLDRYKDILLLSYVMARCLNIASDYLEATQPDPPDEWVFRAAPAMRTLAEEILAPMQTNQRARMETRMSTEDSDPEERRFQAQIRLDEFKRQVDGITKLMDWAIDFAKLALQSVIAVNGGASVALLAFIPHLATADYTEIDVKLLTSALALFTGGVGAGVFAAGTAYISQFAFARTYVWKQKKWEQVPWRRWVGEVFRVFAIGSGVAALLIFLCGVYRATNAFSAL